MRRPDPRNVLHRIMNSSGFGRSRMLLAAPRLAVSGDPTRRTLGRILAATALDRLSPAERAWIERVEARRRVLAEDGAEVRAEFAAGPDSASGLRTRSEERILLRLGVAFMSITDLWGRFLLKLVHELGPASALELGTAFGISTAFQAAGLELGHRGRMVTLDAAADWGEVAQQGLDELGLAGRVERRLGWIHETLGDAVADAAPVDYVFVDAEHQAEPTIRYFELMLPRLAPGAVVVFDDISFNREMRRCWGTIRRHPAVLVALDLGRMGVVAVDGGQAPGRRIT
ncbi:MAG TPA: class I SAM-dependent methyltransferase [Solirubrobacterales bacterium]